MAEDDSEIPATGAVFTFGKSKFGDSSPNKFWIRDDKVVQISCGDEHTGVVSESGKLFMFGSNEWGQLGLGHNNVVNKPSRVKAIKKEKVSKIACGRNHTLVSTESGKVFGFGNNGEGQLGLGNSNNQNVVSPAQVQLPTASVLMMDAGNDHSALLTVSGDLYVWGGNGEGQLGVGEDDEVHEPRKLNFDEKVVCVSCGYYHTAIVTESGKLLTCGESEGGKLGLDDCDDAVRIPTAVDGIDGKVVQVACGGSQTIAITEDGKAYSFGDGANGQLGQGTQVLSTFTPQQITTVSDKFSTAYCGVNHSALITKKGTLYTFGDGRHGKLALGEENFANQFKPCLVHRFRHFKVESASCGGCHTLVSAVVQQQNGDLAGSGYESGEDQVDNALLDPSKKTHLSKANHLYDSMDLEGSIGARNRRREKFDETEGTIERTLPTLSGSFRGGHPPYEGSTTTHKLSPLANDTTTHDAHTVPPIQKSHAVSAHSVPPPKVKAEEDSEDEESEDEEEEKPAHRQPLEKSGESSLSSPKPKPVPRKRPDAKRENHLRSLPPIVKTEESVVNSKPKKAESDEESEDESTDGEPKAVKKEKDKQKEKAKPKKSSKKKEDSEEDSEEDTKKKVSEDETESEDDKKSSKKSKEKKKKPPKKKRTNIFGKKKVLDSDEDEESEEESSEQESVKDKKDKEVGAKSSKKSDKKPKEKAIEDDEDEESEEEEEPKKKKEESETESGDDEDESDKKSQESKKNKDKKKDKKKKEDKKEKTEEDDKSNEEKEESENENDKGKEEDKSKTQNAQEKKSGTCAIL